MSAPVTVIVLTRDEELNLPACLASVCGWAREVLVVDSGSTDRTLDIAASYGAVVAEHPFTTHAAQWAWALGTLPITTDWVLGLDADQRLLPEARAEISRRLADPALTAGVDGFYLGRRQVFRGRWIRHGGYYPKRLLKLFRRDAAAVETGELVDHHFHVRGRTAVLEVDFVEENLKENDVSFFCEKHLRYARLQAREELEGPPPLGRFFGSPDERIRFLKARWRGLPLYVRPVLYLVYRYVLRLGFLDGREGFVFHVLQGFWYRLLVDVNLDELRARGDASARAPGNA